MSWKKTVFSFLAWLFYTILICFGLLCHGTVYCSQLGLNVRLSAVAAVCAVAVIGGTAYWLRRLSGMSGAFCRSRKLCVAAEAAAAVGLLTLGLLLRIWKMGEAGETAAYFEIARVTEGQGIPQIAHGAVCLYVWTLHGIFRLLGNSFFIGVCSQIALQYIGAVGAFFVLRRYAGPVPALTALSFFMCGPYMVWAGLNLSPEPLFFCLLTAAMAVVSKGGRGRLRPPIFLLSGILISLLTYLDVAGVLLLLFAVAVIFCQREEGPLPRRRAGAGLCCLLGFAAGFLGCVFVDSLVSGKPFAGVWNVWFLLYRPEKFALPLTVGFSDAQWESLLLLLLMTLGVFSFWFVKQKEQLTPFVLMVCFTVAGSCFGVFTEEMSADMYLFFFFSVLAGVGLKQCFAGGESAGEVVGERSSEEEPFSDEVFSEEEEQFAVEEQLIEEASRRAEEQSIAEEASLAEEPAKEQSDVGEEAEPVQYLENPLPLPKKHVKKVLDYDYPVADDDDYDN